MTIKQCIKENGWIMRVTELKRFQSVDVAFINNEGREDETEFDISGAHTDAGAKELTTLYNVFCRENGMKNNTVLAVIVAHSADIYEELP